MHYTLKDRIETFWDDVANNYTPDLTELRYQGPVPIFLYGHAAHFTGTHDFMRNRGLKAGTDFATDNSAAVTKGAYLCLKNLWPATSPIVYHDFMLWDTAGLQDVDLTIRQVRGKLVTVSLAGVQALDRWFYNHHRAYRTRINLATNHINKKEWAYTYMFYKSTIAQPDDKDDKIFHIRKGLEVKNFETESLFGGTDKVYV